MTEFDPERTTLVSEPRIRKIVRPTYIVDWEYSSTRFYEDIGEDECTRHHSRTFVTRDAAYRHAASAYVIGRATVLGCTRDACRNGSDPNTYCKYCHPEKRVLIINRLARWLKQRDSRVEQRRVL